MLLNYVLLLKFFIFFIFFKGICITSIIFFFFYLLNYLKINLYLCLYFLVKNLKSGLIIIPILLLCTNNLTFYFYFYEYLWPKDLLYGFNLIHPILFYVSLLTIVISIYSLNVYLRFTLTVVLAFLMSTLFLGMLWGTVNTG